MSASPASPCPRPDGVDPRLIDNPPGLSQIAYRAEDFDGVRRRLLRPRPGEQAIGTWRPADGDLGLQVLEWWAYLADVLSFYNERAANESYLRTAARAQSLTNLVGLLGYRPVPGLAARGSVAALRRASHPNEPLVIPAGMRLASVATPGVPSQTFEVDTTASFDGPSAIPVTLPADASLSPRADGSVSVLLSGRVSGVSVGDQLLLVDRRFAGTTDTWVLVTVTGLAPATDPGTGAQNTMVTLATLGSGWQSAYWLSVLAEISPDATGYRLLRATGATTLWNQGGNPISFTNVGGAASVHLSAVVRAIAAGDLVLLQHATLGGVLARASTVLDALGTVKYPALGSEGPAPGASAAAGTTTPDIPVAHTQLGLTLWAYSTWVLWWMSGLGDFGSVSARYGFRDVGTIVGVPSPSLGALPASFEVPTKLAPAVGSGALLRDATGAGVAVTVTAASAAGVQTQLMVVGAGTPPATLSAPLLAPLQLLPDVVAVSRGVTVNDEVLGSGDATLAAQTFALAKGPLTYLGGGDAPVSTLSVYVDGVAWREVESFYGQSPQARVFVVSRSADASVTRVTFGDGVNGARLPSGTVNVRASYRYGAGAAAPPAGRLTTIVHPQNNLAAIENPVPVSGGADPQSPADVRRDAPASVSTFGRAISAADYEQIAARAPGVARASAQVTIADAAQRSTVTVYVGDDATAVQAANQALAAAEDPNRPVTVSAATPQAIGLSCVLVVAADRELEAVVSVATAAVCDPVAGLFSPGRMGIGRQLYRSAVSAALMVPGVIAVRGLLLRSSESEVLDPGPGGFFVLSSANVSITGVSAVVEVNDGLEAYYAERLWQLLPALYRNADAVALNATGPLREILERIGAEVAVTRRGIDRLWADQAIETCADWVVPYLGDLLATNLVNNLDPRAQRLDVAKTIHYRRRKGSVQVLEELAADVTGWTAHAVEAFRRLSRTRHGLDPIIGPGGQVSASAGELASLLGAEGLTGRLTGGRLGGFADLRSGHGAALTDGPFDESAHAADLRRGRGSQGHFAIPTLLVFLWRLRSFAVHAGTPVPVAGSPGHYSFDPTGREIELFLAPAPPVDAFSDQWTARLEWQVPGPLTASLQAALDDTGSDPPPPTRAPYPDAGVPASWNVTGAEVSAIWPERGRFATTAAATPAQVDYHYGFSATVGAGPYDRTLLSDPPEVMGAETIVQHGSGLDTALAAAGAAATVTLADSLTYATLGAPGQIESLLVRAGASQRPVLRPGGGQSPWLFTGAPGAELVLDGLTVSGCDVVLRGAFASVRITGCTFDPGSAGRGSPPLRHAVDGVTLAPTRLFIEADPAATGAQAGIGQLAVDHSIMGPIRTRLGGSVDTLSISDSIVQGLPESRGTVVYDPVALAQGLLSGQASGPTASVFPLAAAVLAAIPGLAPALQAFLGASPAAHQAGLPLTILNALDTLIVGPSIYNPALFDGVALSPGVIALAGASTLDLGQRAALNRGLLQDAFPIALGVAALAVADASVALSRVTVLGRVTASRLQASDCILDDFTTVAGVADGCVRFSAYAQGSVIPTPYESPRIPAGAPIFTSRAYGHPGYAQLLDTADTAVVGAGGSILTGAENGSELGAFSAELGPVKEHGLLVKYAEFMPLGLAPVIVHVT